MIKEKFVYMTSYVLIIYIYFFKELRKEYVRLPDIKLHFYKAC